jgi:hypothetical protein
MSLETGLLAVEQALSFVTIINGWLAGWLADLTAGLIDKTGFPYP